MVFKASFLWGLGQMDGLFGATLWDREIPPGFGKIGMLDFLEINPKAPPNPFMKPYVGPPNHLHVGLLHFNYGCLRLFLIYFGGGYVKWEKAPSH